MKMFREIIDIITTITSLIAALLLAYAVFAFSIQYNPTTIYLFNLKVFATGAILAWWSFAIDGWLDGKKSKNGKSKRTKEES